MDTNNGQQQSDTLTEVQHTVLNALDFLEKVIANIKANGLVCELTIDSAEATKEYPATRYFVRIAVPLKQALIETPHNKLVIV
jgi:hypothetical protein